MFLAIALGLFLLALFWTIRRQSRAHRLREVRLETEVEQGQRDLEKERAYSNRLLMLLSSLHDKKVSLTGRLPWTELAQTLVETARNLVRVERVVLLQWDPTFLELRGTAALGLSPEQFSALHIRRGDGVLGKALQQGKPLVVNSAESSAAPSLPAESFLAAPYMIIPFVLQDQLGGALALSGPADGLFDQKQIQLATLLAGQAQLVMENLELYQSRLLSQQEVVEALSQLRSSESLQPGHGLRVRSLVRAMACELHFPDLLVQQFERGAALHDVGKIGLPETLLAKPEKLTPEEYARVKKHPEIGNQLLRPMSFLRPVAPIVLYHHEWFNGQGYPEGLAGEEIPLGARVVGIVDAWDAMTTDQPYRPALSRHAAIAELRQQAGTQFDPKLVDVFLRGIDDWERELDSARLAEPASSARGSTLLQDSH